ncbi:MAG: undecaprenyl/decaprenyl-phosphate alpha-N-acetylglucosaminyl 1-phosphate transferase, partial [Candidatus Marinimicrobia bacterium]|nr:undecaprenyl/decaprenyl-phosphate alpha-N-acetylglucosaminyl 1-phosphate transferase [Candidatus Neomarinimicrobiota bacterium]
MQNLHQLEYIMLLLIGSIVLGFGLAQISLKIAPKVGLMDIPGSADHKKHQNPIPLTGGVVLMDTMIVMILLTKMWGDAHIWAIFVSGMIIGLFGLMDDYFHLSVTKKLIGQIFGITMLIYLGVQVQFFNSPEFLIQIEEPWASWLNIIFTFLWLLTVTNSFNFIDSSDGLAVGLSGVSAGFFLLLAFVTG